MAKKTPEQIAALQADIHSRAAIVKKAYEDWKAANANNPNAQYTLKEQQKYLPKGFKNPNDYGYVGGWEKAKELGLDAYDQFGNIITRESMVPAGWGNAIQSGQYVAPNVMASAMGQPQSEVNRLLDITRSVGIPDEAKTKDWYKYDTGNWSNVPISGQQPGYTGTQAGLNAFIKSLSSGLNPTTGTTTTTGNVTDAANNLVNATTPPTPQFIQPYQRVTGSGAFGETDTNPFATNKRMI